MAFIIEVEGTPSFKSKWREVNSPREKCQNIRSPTVMPSCLPPKCTVTNSLTNSLAKFAKATKRKLLVSQAFSIMLDSLFFFFLEEWSIFNLTTPLYTAFVLGRTHYMNPESEALQLQQKPKGYRWYWRSEGSHLS